MKIMLFVVLVSALASTFAGKIDDRVAGDKGFELTRDFPGDAVIARDKWTADPTARVFGDRLYLYTSHDIAGTPGHFEM